MKWLQADHKQLKAAETVSWLLILGLAFFLRARRLDTTSLWGDQSFTLNTAMRWVNGRTTLPLAANKSSLGFMNPPMIEYLYAAALKIWPDVLSVAVLTMLSGLVAILVTGWAVRKAFGKRAALWAMLIFAVNPWSVHYSQLIWNQTMVPVFAALTFATLLLYFAVEQKAWYLVLGFISAACLTQVHPGSGVQLLTMGLIFLLFWRRLRLWPLVAGVAAFVLLYLPFIRYEILVGWGDVPVILEIVRQPATTSMASLLVSLDLMQAQGLSTAVPYVPLFDRLAVALLLLSLLFAAGKTAHAFIRHRRQPHDAPATPVLTGLSIMLLWFVVPVLFYLRSSYHLQNYYLLSQWPVHFVLIGVFVDGVQAGLERVAGQVNSEAKRYGLAVAAWLVPLPLLLLATWQFAFNLQFQDVRWQKEDGRLQVRQMRTVIHRARELMVARPQCRLVVVSEGHQVEISRLSLLQEFTFPERILLADGDLALPLPADCAIYLDALPGSRASRWLATTAVPVPDTAVPVPGETWRFYVLDTGTQAGLTAGKAASPTPVWENGVALTHYGRGRVTPGATLPLTLTWSVEAEPPQVAYHTGTYLLSDDNQVVAQSDGPGFDSIQWRVGDSFITWFEIPVPLEVPTGAYHLAVGLYSWPQLQRVGLAGGDNTAYLESLQIP